MELEDDRWADELRVAAPAPLVALANAAAASRVLVRGPCDEGRQPPLKVAKEGSDQEFKQGDVVCLHALHSRPELNGQGCTVVSFDDPSGRYAVRLTSGECIRVHWSSVRRSLFAGLPSAPDPP